MSLAIDALEAHLSYLEHARTPGRLRQAYLTFLAASGVSQSNATGQDPEEAIRSMGYTPQAIEFYVRSELLMLDSAPTIGVSDDMLDVAMFNAGIWVEPHPEDTEIIVHEDDESQIFFEPNGDPDWSTLGFEADALDAQLPILTREMLPWTTDNGGFLWFEKPVPYPDFDINLLIAKGAYAFPTVPIKAIAWQPVDTVAIDHENVAPGVAIYLFTEQNGQLMLLDFTGWAYGYQYTIDHEWEGTLKEAAKRHEAGEVSTEEEIERMMDTIKSINPHVAMTRILLSSIWGIMTQSLDSERPPRPIRRRAERTGLTSFAEYGEVRVITLRTFLNAASRPDRNVSKEEVEWSHRWIVRGHWAWRHCAEENADEGESCRKRVYIHPYVKGPEDKPLILKEKVYAVVR